MLFKDNQDIVNLHTDNNIVLWITTKLFYYEYSIFIILKGVLEPWVLSICLKALLQLL